MRKQLKIKKQTIIILILYNFVLGSVIYTEEHKAYKCLKNYGNIYKIVCHKNNFLIKKIELITQNVWSINKNLKYEILTTKG